MKTLAKSSKEWETIKKTLKIVSKLKSDSDFYSAIDQLFLGDVPKK